MEVNLSDAPAECSWASLTEAIVAKTVGKTWLFNPRFEALEAVPAWKTEAPAERDQQWDARRSRASTQTAHWRHFERPVAVFNTGCTPEPHCRKRSGLIPTPVVVLRTWTACSEICPLIVSC